MRTTAKALGITAGDQSADAQITFGTRKLPLDKWARRSDPGAKGNFETTCKTAFVAFSRASVDVLLNGINDREAQRVLDQLEQPPVKVDTGNDLSGLFGVLIGGGITGLIALGTAHRSNRREDGEALRKLAADFSSDVYAHVADRNDDLTRSRALASSHRLLDALEVWEKSGAENGVVRDAAKEARQCLSYLVDVTNTNSIGNISGDGGAREVAATVKKVHDRTAGIAEYVDGFWRRPAPKSEAGQLPSGGNSAGQ